MKKICPKCGGIMLKDCCIKCGYMTNGNVAGKYISKDRFEELKIYDAHFDEIYRNENSLMIFLLGPLNFSYRSLPILGGIASVVHILLFLKVSALLNPVSKIYSFLYLILHIIYLIIIRIIYCIFVNKIILKIDSIRIKMIKNRAKNEEDFYNKLNNHNDKSIGSIILSILISICIFLVLLLIYIKK